MTFNVTFDADIESARKELKSYQRTALPKAIVRSLNRAGKPTLTRARSSVSKVTGFRAKEIKDKKYISDIKASKNRFAYTIRARRRAPNLSHFQTKSQRNSALRARALGNMARKGKTFVRTKTMAKNSQGHQKGFLVTVPTKQGRRLVVMKRLTAHRMPIAPMFGPNLAKVFARDAVQRHLKNRAIGIWRREFPRQLEYYLSRIR